MQELTFSREEMAARVARFQQLDVLEAQKTGMPLEVQDIILSRKLMPVITLDDNRESVTPFGRRGPIHGAGGMTMTYAICPAGTGPSLHRHLRTFETFTVITGRFEFSWGEEGVDRLTLDPFDVVSIPPGISRSFRNVSDGEAVLQVIITGGAHDMNDVEVPSATARKIESLGGDYLQHFKAMGLTFTSNDG